MDIHCSSLIEVLMLAPDMLRLWCDAPPAALLLRRLLVRRSMCAQASQSLRRPFASAPAPAPVAEQVAAPQPTATPNPEQTTRELYNSQVHAWDRSLLLPCHTVPSSQPCQLSQGSQRAGPVSCMFCKNGSSAYCAGIPATCLLAVGASEQSLTYMACVH